MKHSFFNPFRILCACLAIAMSLLVLISCDRLGAAAFERRYWDLDLIPGECLIDNDISCIYCNQGDAGKRYYIRLLINVDVESEKVEKTVSPYHIIRHCPSNNIYQRFGSNAGYVKEEYNKVWNSLELNQYSTFFIDNGIVLTADVEFAGIPAGENIAGIFVNGPVGGQDDIFSIIEPFNKSQYDKMLHVTGIQEYSIYGPKNNVDDYNSGERELIHVEKKAAILFSLYVVNKYKFVEQSVNFTLTIPVKSAQYLTWLNDKLSDENAQMTWKDEVLTCTFHSDTGLQKIGD